MPVLQAQRNPQTYLERFKQLPNAVLFASGACWEGVDFPGDMVSLLIIVKLPFQVPDPLGEAMRKQYGNLHSYIRAEVVPEMQIKLRQGFGRAIRTETDSCVVAVLDPRAAPGKRYHQAVLDALPEMPVSDKLTDIQSFLQSKKNPSYFEPRFLRRLINMRAICYVQEVKNSDLTMRQQILICRKALRKLRWPCVLELFAQAGTKNNRLRCVPV